MTTSSLCSKTSEAGVYNVHFCHLLWILKLPDGTLTESTKESYDVLMKEHFPGCTLQNNGSQERAVSSEADLPQLIDPIPWIET